MIKNVLIVGFGGVGAVYASIISKNPNINLKILTDVSRFEKYSKIPTVINEEECVFDYILPNECFNADLIIISTKFNDITDVLENIKNFVNENTVIISLLNGIISEDLIKQKYPQAQVLSSYLICHSIMRENRTIRHDGINKIVCEKNDSLKLFLEDCSINYEFTLDIKSAMWQKFMLNIVANQLSAVTHMTFGEMNKLPYIESLLNKILEEVVLIAKAEGVQFPEALADNAIRIFTREMVPYGKTSMLQDIENNRATEIDAFAGTIIELGKVHGIPTPYNTLFKFLIDT